MYEEFTEVLLNIKKKKEVIELSTYQDNRAQIVTPKKQGWFKCHRFKDQIFAKIPK